MKLRTEKQQLQNVVNELTEAVNKYQKELEAMKKLNKEREKLISEQKTLIAKQVGYQSLCPSSFPKRYFRKTIRSIRLRRS